MNRRKRHVLRAVVIVSVVVFCTWGALSVKDAAAQGGLEAMFLGPSQ